MQITAFVHILLESIYQVLKDILRIDILVPDRKIHVIKSTKIPGKLENLEFFGGVQKF